MCPGWQPGFAPTAWEGRDAPSLPFPEGKVLTSLMTCLQAPQGEIKSSCRSLWRQRTERGSVSPEAWGQLLRFRARVPAQLQRKSNPHQAASNSQAHGVRDAQKNYKVAFHTSKGQVTGRHVVFISAFGKCLVSTHCHPHSRDTKVKRTMSLAFRRFAQPSGQADN